MASGVMPADEKQLARPNRGVLGIRGSRPLTLWFCWKLVPETKDRDLGQIEAIFRERAGEQPLELPATRA